MTDDFRNHTLSLWTSNSFRRFFMQDGSDGQFACEPVTQRDGHPDLLFPGGPDGPVARRFLATWNACKGISTETLEQERSIAEVTLRSIPLRETLRQIEARALALAESLNALEPNHRFDDDVTAREREARAIAAMCAAALAGTK